MPNFLDKSRWDELERRWMLANAARKAEMSRSLRDPQIGMEQGLSVVETLIKAVCLVCVIGIILHSFGIPQVSVIASFLAMPFVATNPKQMFWRVVFLDRAQAAFDSTIDQLDER